LKHFLFAAVSLVLLLAVKPRFDQFEMVSGQQAIYRSYESTCCYLNARK